MPDLPYPVFLVVGGDARQGDRRIGNAFVRAVASKKFGGNGHHRSLISTIRGGRIRLVVLLVRWLGHSEATAITSACRSVGVRYLIVDRGLSTVWKLVGEVDRG